MKKMLCLLIACMVIAAMPLMAFAVEIPDVDRTNCSIHLTVRYDGESVPGGELTAIRVGYIHEDDGNYSFRRIGDDKDLPDVQSASASEEMAEYVAESDYPFESKTVTVGEDGTARFYNLKTGLYLICQDTPAPGFHAIKPFLVSVPYMEFGKYIYHVSALIKSELILIPDPEPTEPSTEPTEPSTEPTEPSTEPTEPSTEPTDPGTEPTVPSTEPSTEPTAPEETTVPEETTQPVPTEPKPTKPKPDPDKLPQTGQLNWPVPVLATLGLLLLIAGIFLRSKKQVQE